MGWGSIGEGDAPVRRSLDVTGNDVSLDSRRFARRPLMAVQSASPTDRSVRKFKHPPPSVEFIEQTCPSPSSDEHPAKLSGRYGGVRKAIRDVAAADRSTGGGDDGFLGGQCTHPRRGERCDLYGVDGRQPMAAGCDEIAVDRTVGAI